MAELMMLKFAESGHPVFRASLLCRGMHFCALECAAARVCREAGARVRTNVFVVVVESLPPLRADGAPHIQCADVDGAALRQARRRKECTCPELSGAHGRAKLVVLAAEVGGRWSLEVQTFLRLLVRAKTCSLPEVLQVRARQTWLFRWSSLLACSAAGACASSLLELHGWADGPLCWTGAGCRVTRCGCVSWFALRA